MNTITKIKNQQYWNRASGFTIIELLVVMVVASIAMLGIYGMQVAVTQSYTTQQELAEMQQNMRSAMYLIKNDLRNASRDPGNNQGVGITNVGRFNPDAHSAIGYPGITMTTLFDADRDGAADSDQVRTISYRVFDPDGDLHRGLYRQDSRSPNPANWDLVFDGIEDISFAFAYDNDDDLDLDRGTVGVGVGSVIWAIDTDNTVGLDTNADNVADGDITVLDDNDGDGWINTTDGNLGAQIPYRNIRAVKIWLLARSSREDFKFTDNATYALAHRIIDMGDPINNTRDHFRHKLLVGAVALHNQERTP